jgi:hypothetical protein
MTAEFKIKPQAPANTSTNSGELTCRNCKTQLSRIKRSDLAKFFLFGLPFKKYICYKCSRRTYRWVPK